MSTQIAVPQIGKSDEGMFHSVFAFKSEPFADSLAVFELSQTDTQLA